MSTIEAATLDDVIAVAADPIVEAARAEERRDRRAHVRLRAEELRWVRGVRLKAGPSVTLIDLSSGGALIDARVPLRPGSRVILALTAPASSVERASEVLRCELARIDGGTLTYRGACRFAEPLLIDAIRSIASPAVPASPPAAHQPGGPQQAWQKIVVRYRDGTVVKGYVLDFHPSRDHLSVWPSVNAARDERVVVPLSRVKALFFVRDFDGDPVHSPGTTFDESAAGRRIEVTFEDGEVLRGTTLAYRPDGTGFFVTPADASGNNQRVFVAAAAVSRVRFP